MRLGSLACVSFRPVDRALCTLKELQTLMRTTGKFTLPLYGENKCVFLQTLPSLSFNDLADGAGTVSLQGATAFPSEGSETAPIALTSAKQRLSQNLCKSTVSLRVGVRDLLGD